jgi:hypothetical protein
MTFQPPNFPLSGLAEFERVDSDVPVFHELGLWCFNLDSRNVGFLFYWRYDLGDPRS